jgi:hypothetical protein
MSDHAAAARFRLAPDIISEFVSPELQADTQIARAHPRPRNSGLPSAFVVRTKAFRRVGGFRDDVVIGEFVDWYSRALEDALDRRRAGG